MVMGLKNYSSIFDLPPGVYTLHEDDPIKLEKTLSQIAGTPLWGVSEYGLSGERGHELDSVFFWGPEASSYFCFDNIYDEVAIGIRWHLGDNKAVHKEVLRLLNQVGLAAFTEAANLTSPWELSGGQQQRLIAAVILSRKPDVVLAFDPLIYVDYQSRTNLYIFFADAILDIKGKLIFASDDSSRPPHLSNNEIIQADGRYVIRKKSFYDQRKPQRKDFAPDTSAEEPVVDSTLSPDSKCILQITNLRWEYPNGSLGIEVREASFSSGNIYVICGPNGGGKSSFMRLLIANRRLPRSGTMYYAGCRVRNPFRDLVKTSKLAFTFQDPNVHMVGGTVMDFLLPPARETFPQEVCIAEYLDQDILATPFWVRQAAIFLNVVVSTDDILVLDEPLDGLSCAIFGDAAIKLLKNKAKAGAIVLIVTHNPSLAVSLSDKFVWISNNTLQTTNEKETPASNRARLIKWLSNQ